MKELLEETSTCCLNKIDCALLLSCLGMGLCLEDDRELGIKGEGEKKASLGTLCEFKGSKGVGQTKGIGIREGSQPCCSGLGCGVDLAGGRSSPICSCMLHG